MDNKLQEIWKKLAKKKINLHKEEIAIKNKHNLKSEENLISLKFYHKPYAKKL